MRKKSLNGKRVMAFALAFSLVLGEASAVVAAPADASATCATETVAEQAPEAKTAEELAELCGANSTVTFRRTFLRLFNCPVAQWLRQKRAEQVLKLLRTTHLPLPEIAEQCGFANQSYLSDFCKRNLGDTPVNIRKNRN